MPASLLSVCFGGVVLLAGSLLLGACKENAPETLPDPAPTPAAGTFYRGADLSFSPEIEATSTRFTDQGRSGTPLALLQQRGLNLVRLRLWHTPPSGRSHLAEVAAYARRAKQAGLAVLLDLHYSDSWADPGQQATPRSWQNLPATVLQDSVYQYTRRVLRVLADQQATPDLVQVGNEINGGMLWPQGRIQLPADYPALASLLRRGLQAVTDADPQRRIRTVVHFAGPGGANYFFEQLARQNVAYDVQALSYYPQFHGRSLVTLSQQLTALVNRYQKDLLLVETAYPFTLGWNDYTHNSVGQADQLIPGYDATPAGQQAYLLALRRLIKDLPDGHGLGFCYWAPDWVAFKGPTATDGSAAENQALFDFANAGLPALEAFRAD
jgi:arabinogalactan endo-1,4-beta-galactosidase